MRVTSDDGTSVVVHDLGGHGPGLLVCHATGLCGRAYERLAAAVGGALHVWAVDLRGHGDSAPPPDDDFAWAGMVRDVIAVRHALPAGPLHVFGHSMGGAAALQAAADHPGLFASAYVYEPIIVAPEARSEHTANPLADQARRRRPTFPSKAEALLRYASSASLGALEAASLAAYVEHGMRELPDGTVTLKCAPEHEARTFEASAMITSATVAAARIPTVVAIGSEPSPLAALAPGVVAALPDARLRVHQHLGHFGPLQSPATVGADLVRHASTGAP
ncbi:MAG TPA: alpha/beta hydrolase [Mycobacteriales bacterium]|nr:alpha/beta hydrolase [Mycobacteriales bacterium]